MPGTKLTNGVYTLHAMTCISHSPFLGPLPDALPFQIAVNGDTLTDQHGAEWTWNEDRHHYERGDAAWTFWTVFDNPPGGGWIQQFAGGWELRYDGIHQKDPM